MRRHILAFSLLAGAVLVCPLLAGLPQATKDKGDKDTPKPGGSYLGKILEIDVAKRTLILRDAKAVTRRGTDVERVVAIRLAPGVDTPTDPPAEKAQEKTADGVYTFVAAPLVEITLDGKAAILKNLKVGQFARVRVSKSGNSATTGTDKDTPVKKDRWEIDRIDAFSKEPPAARGKG